MGGCLSSRSKRTSTSPQHASEDVKTRELLTMEHDLLLIGLTFLAIALVAGM
jgi:hypothetical protein